jgi:hypothetical protein
MTQVRLAFHPEGIRTLRDIGREREQEVSIIRLAYNRPNTLKPSVRLAMTSGIGIHPGQDELRRMKLQLLISGQNKGDFEHVRAKATNPSVRLGLSAGQAERNGTTLTPCTTGIPALLVSFYYLDNFLKYQPEYAYRDWVLDSGAFSAFNSGKTIDLNQYMDTCKQLMSKDKTLVEVFALDVIGDHRASLRNCETMWKNGIPAIPCYHIGEPIDALMQMAKHYPKLAIGGVARLKAEAKKQFAQACFSRVWPKKIHGFGYGSENHIMAFPFHSCDATNWELGPCGFGRWNAFGKMSVRGSSQNLRAEVEYYLKLEAKAQSRWRKEMAILDAQPDVNPALRLAVAVQRTEHGRPGGDGRMIKALKS